MPTTSDQDPTILIGAVDERRKRAETKALDISLNELGDMYEAGELKIKPEYQRLFRWPASKQSQFIESLILEMPIPPIFAIEVAEGTWELIDGLQRVSTYLHFRGKLDALDCEPPITRGETLTLEECDIVPELNGATFQNLPSALQIRLKRSFLRVEIVRRETDTRFRYYMFKRLNTGGEILSDQEVRNCTIRLLGDRFNTFIQSLSADDAFKQCITPLSRDKRKRMGAVELVLRFFAFHVSFGSFRHDVGPFMTEFMERVTDETATNAIAFDYARQEAVFRKTFRLLQSTLGENTCRRWTGNRFGGGFSNHHFEAFSLGVAKVVEDIDLEDQTAAAAVEQVLDGIKKDPGFQELTKGGGRNSPGPYREKIDFVAERLRRQP
jgi:hypothetical protein